MNKLRNYLTNPNHWIILLVLLSTPLVFRAAGNALGERDNQVRQWLPRGFDETKSYDWFLDHFGSEEFTLVSWEGATVKDERLATLAMALRKHVPDDDSSESRNKGWFRKIVTGPEMLSGLRDGGLDLSHTAATNRLRGSLIGVDGKTTGLLVFLEEAGRKHRHEVVDTIRAEAKSVCIEPGDLRLGGPTIDSVALDQESERSRSKLALISLALGTLAAWKCLRNVRLVAVVLLTALYCGAATLALSLIHI